jgi:hypothetical protein
MVDEPDITLILKTALEDSGFFQDDIFNDAELGIICIQTWPL